MSGNVNPSAYIYLLDVNTKTDMLSLIVPNDYDKQILLKMSSSCQADRNKNFMTYMPIYLRIEGQMSFQNL